MRQLEPQTREYTTWKRLELPNSLWDPQGLKTPGRVTLAAESWLETEVLVTSHFVLIGLGLIWGIQEGSSLQNVLWASLWRKEAWLSRDLGRLSDQFSFPTPPAESEAGHWGPDTTTTLLRMRICEGMCQEQLSFWNPVRARADLLAQVRIKWMSLTSVKYWLYFMPLTPRKEGVNFPSSSRCPEGQPRSTCAGPQQPEVLCFSTHRGKDKTKDIFQLVKMGSCCHQQTHHNGDLQSKRKMTLSGSMEIKDGTNIMQWEG